MSKKYFLPRVFRHPSVVVQKVFVRALWTGCAVEKGKGKTLFFRMEIEKSQEITRGASRARMAWCLLALTKHVSW